MPRGIADTSVGSALFALSLLYFSTDALIAYGWTLVLSLATLKLTELAWRNRTTEAYAIRLQLVAYLMMAVSALDFVRATDVASTITTLTISALMTAFCSSVLESFAWPAHARPRTSRAPESATLLSTVLQVSVLLPTAIWLAQRFLGWEPLSIPAICYLTIAINSLIVGWRVRRDVYPYATVLSQGSLPVSTTWWAALCVLAVGSELIRRDWLSLFFGLTAIAVTARWLQPHGRRRTLSPEAAGGKVLES